MMWVLKRTVSMRQFFWVPKTYAKKYGQEYIYNFTLNFFEYLNLDWLLIKPADQDPHCMFMTWFDLKSVHIA